MFHLPRQSTLSAIWPLFLSPFLAVAPLHAQNAPAPSAASVSTRDLFSYRRDDAAPDGLTSIRLNAARTATAPVQQNIFGNFLEHMSFVVYEGLSAQVLLNPNLERIEANEAAPQRWDLSGAATWQDGGYFSPRAVRLSNDGTLSQRVFLPVHRVKTYNLAFYARAPQGDGKINLSLRAGDDRNGPTALQSTLGIAGSDWKRYTLPVKLPPLSGLLKGQPARFVVAGATANIEIDQIELMPDDAIGGFDPDVIRRARQWKIPVLRYSGNFSSGYHWRDGVGPHALRPTYRNHAWGGAETNHFGTDEFLRLCRLIGAVPQFGANAGNGTPEEAAAWVKYCNDPAATFMASHHILAMNFGGDGSGNGPNVPIWEIGNELYGGWQVGHTDAPGNAERFVRFRDAMLKADPRIQILATGKGDEFQPDGLKRNADWNEAVLRAALANGGRVPDWLSLHPLVPLPSGLDNLPYAERYESAMAHPYFVDETLLPATIRSIQNVEGAQAKTRIAPTEWGIIVGGERWFESPNHDVVAGAIFNALTLNAFLRHSDWVTLANMTALMHGGGIKKPDGVVIVDPQYYTQQMYAAAAPRTPIETVWSGPGRDVPARGFLPAVANVPDVDVFSALSEDKNRLMAFVVNRSLDQVHPARLEISGFTVRGASAQILTAPDAQAHNTWQQPDTVAPHPFALPPLNGNRVNVSLPPHSLVVFSFARGR